MKTYDNKKDKNQTADVDRSSAELVNLTMFPENPFAEVAYEWNNALQIAIEKMWEA